MSNDILSSVLTFIKESNLPLRYPNVIRYSKAYDGKFNTQWSSHVRVIENQLADQTVLSTLILFTAMDVFIDCLQPNIEGENFDKRYKSFQTNSDDFRVIVKEVFRILTLMRNTIVHRRSQTKIRGNVYSWGDKSKPKYMECTYDGILYLNTLTVFLIEYWTNENRYSLSMIGTYYEKLRSEIIFYVDKFGSTLDSISPPVKLNLLRRYRNDVALTDADNSSGSFKVDRMVIHPEENAIDEFYVTWNGMHYLVPGEILGSESSIKFSTLPEWEFPKNKFY